MSHGINVCLGTDSSASNNSLSMLREMQLVSLIHKGTHRDATAVSASEVFDKVYDGYLKSFSVESGVQSYGEVTDLLLNWFYSDRFQVAAPLN